MTNPTHLNPEPTETPQEPENSTLPPWWLQQQQLLENQFQMLEKSSDENRGYLQRIQSLMNKATDEGTQSSPEPETGLTAKNLSKSFGKQPVQITVLNEHEKYTFDSEAPGILLQQPDNHPSNSTPPLTNSFPTHSNAIPLTKPTQQTYKNTTTPLFQDPTLTDKNTPQTFFPKPKIEIPLFDGTNPRGWIRKCDRYFSIFDVPDTHKLPIASMYFTGKAEIWYDGYIMQKHHLSWHEFAADLCHRFCNKNQFDVIKEFNKLSQITTVADYQENFEELQPLMLQKNCNLPESYFVSSFNSGLQEQIRNRVKIHEPVTLADAYRKAQLYELSLEIETSKFKPTTRLPNPYAKSTTSQYPHPQQSSPTTIPKQNLLEYRKTNNLCFRCGDRFSPGHKCKQRQLNLMEEEEILEETEDTYLEQEEGNLEISMNALTGSACYSTIRIQGTIKGNLVSILVDSGSTHSFITPGWSKEGLDLQQTNLLFITVANGEKLQSTAKASQL
ncbi:hypothetical protein V6N13_000971 [Hibiscus sabdariffa]